jgi:hypothetical protein
MSNTRQTVNIKKFALTVFTLTALIILALAVFKDSQRVIKPMPLHTPLPGNHVTGHSEESDSMTVQEIEPGDSDQFVTQDTETDVEAEEEPSSAGSDLGSE